MSHRYYSTEALEEGHTPMIARHVARSIPDILNSIQNGSAPGALECAGRSLPWGSMLEVIGILTRERRSEKGTPLPHREGLEFHPYHVGIKERP